MSKYVPPSARTLKGDEPLTSISINNFPVLPLSPISLGNSPKTSSDSVWSPNSVASPRLNFSSCFTPKVEEDATGVEDKINEEMRKKLIKEGWVFLSYSVLKDPAFFERWHNKMASFDSYEKLQEKFY
jgi:hypothetical protein